MTKDIDVQAQAISDGLKALSDLLEEPIAREALDLGKNAETAARYETLRRLRRSLTQYLERDGDLFYVSLLGHFSAGKSSTINCILDLWGKPNERKTNLRPTDKAITLITNSANSGFLLGVINEGAVTIRYEGVEHPLLENVVIADTPGSGDPQQLAEIARESSIAYHDART
jgi:hypothetical protein